MHRLVEIWSPVPLPVATVASSSELARRLAIYSYYVKEPSLQVERAYTPLALLSRADPHTLSFWVKRYTDGEMSRYLHRLRPSAAVALRGPEPTWALGDRPVPREVVLVGTKLLT